MIEATHRDDRGDEGMHFGFVYFNDGRRVAYTVPETYGEIIHPDSTGQGWPAVTVAHVKAAREFLHSEGLDV